MRLLVLAVLALTAVAPDATAQKKKRDLLTRAEIMASVHKDQDLHSAIRALRPQFLVPPPGNRSFGGGAQGAIAVYVDRIRLEGINVMKSMAAASVEEVRYLDPTRSQNEYGITANSGAIVIKRFKSASDTLRVVPPR